MLDTIIDRPLSYITGTSKSRPELKSHNRGKRLITVAVMCKGRSREQSICYALYDHLIGNRTKNKKPTSQHLNTDAKLSLGMDMKTGD
jgi:hypothetical protein